MLEPEDISCDVFNWWKTHEPTFPILSKLVKKYLIIPATSVPSERLFNIAGDIITDTRTCLTGNNAGMLIFMAKNVKYMPLPV